MVSTEASGTGPSQVQLVDALDGWGAADVLATPDSREAFFRGMTHRSLEQWVLRVNGVILGSRHGYLPRYARSHQTETVVKEGKPELHVIYNSIDPGDRQEIMLDAFNAAQAMDNVNHGITMLGIVTTGAHCLHNAHTRTTVAGRQLLAPEGAGYRGNAQDRDYYSNLVDSPGRYLAQSLHPLRANLIERYSRVKTREVLAGLGSAGLALNGVTGPPFEIVRDALPQAWPEDERVYLAALLTERHFNLLTLTDYLGRLGKPIVDFVDESHTKLRLDKVIRLIRSYNRGVPDLALPHLHSLLKHNFVRSIIDCIAHGDDTIYGPPAQVLDSYRLPPV
jgi:hypothetical protein